MERKESTIFFLEHYCKIPFDDVRHCLMAVNGESNPETDVTMYMCGKGCDFLWYSTGSGRRIFIDHEVKYWFTM